ncbi:hypothetical protein EVAR_61068_1 [Eumeta japonica]|uniref:Uncharacterized protein n=1 Tax=Eumeta variegata TaxID=151549 RepID=A0A4C1Z9A1_EUMVA|nr:hypothetical protein EVAR_61068_1 [Eumeta japonica]
MFTPFARREGGLRLAVSARGRTVAADALTFAPGAKAPLKTQANRLLPPLPWHIIASRVAFGNNSMLRFNCESETFLRRIPI